MTTTANEQALLAIDLGNGTTSYIAGNGKQGSFPSLVLAYRDTNGLGMGISREVFQAKDKTTWLVGEECREEVGIARSTDSSFYSSNEIRILLLKVLADAGIPNPIIVAGLPTEFYNRDHKQFEESIRKWAKGEGYTVQAVKVVPQWAAPWFDDQLEDEGGNPVPLKDLLVGTWGIIDIGQGTTDIGQFKDGRSSDTKHGESKGVSDIHKSIFTTLTNNPLDLNEAKKAPLIPKEFKLHRHATPHTVDKWLRDGHILWRGMKLDMNAISLPARLEFAKDVLPRSIANVWGNTDFMTGVICAGGGASVLGMEVFKQYITCPLYRAKNPDLSIVRGLFRFAKTQVLRQIAK